MGLLDKALRDRSQDTAKEAPRRKADASSFVGEPEKLAALSAALLNLPASSDRLLTSFLLIDEMLRLNALALLVASGEELLPAALRGFSRLSPGSLDRRTFPAASTPQTLNAAARRSLDGLLQGPSPDLRMVPFSCAKGERPLGFWIFAPPDASRPESLDSLFQTADFAPPRLPLPLASRSAGKLVDGNKGFLTLLRFSLAESPALRGTSCFGPEAVLACLATASAEILGTSGTTFTLPDSKLLVLLYSSMRPDAELALAQFRKSLRRALPRLGDLAALPAIAMSLPRDIPESRTELERFISS